MNRRAAASIVSILVVSLVAGCATPAISDAPAGSAAASASASASIRPTPSTTALPVSTPSPSPAATLPTQTDTAWGRIWDAVPGAFPRFAGSNPTDTGEAPTSAQFEVPAPAAQVTAFYQGALESSGYTTVALSGPMEDGSRQLDSQGPSATCRIRTTIAPHGSTTLVTVLFGAACPFE